MGLREQNAARARELMVETALGLFFELGYDATTMEEVARRAGVGSSTLYRYFDTKDALLLAPLGEPGHMAAYVTASPAEQPLGLVLGQAILALLTTPRSPLVADARFHELIVRNPRPQARLLEWYHEEERLLREAIAQREHSAPDDVRALFTARAATLVLEVASNDSPAGATLETVADRARQVMTELQGRSLTLPRLAD